MASLEQAGKLDILVTIALWTMRYAVFKLKKEENEQKRWEIGT
jgi:hypothetical protein